MYWLLIAPVTASTIAIVEPAPSISGISASDTLGDAINHILSGWREDFPVVFGDHVLGMLTREDMTRDLARAAPKRASASRCGATLQPSIPACGLSRRW